MRSEKRILLNSAVVFLQNIVLNVIALFTTGYIADSLGVEGWGRLQYSISYVVLLSSLVDLGIRPVLYREAASDLSRAPRCLGDLFVIRGGLLFLFSLIVVTGALVQESSADTRLAIYIALASQVFFILHSNFTMIFEAHQRMEFIPISVITGKVLVIGGSLAVLYQGHGVIAVSLVYAGGNFIQIPINYAITRRWFAPPQFRWAPREFLKVARVGLYFAFMGFFVKMSEVDSVMLKWMRGEEAVGFYATAQDLVLKFEMIGDAVSMAIFPALAAMVAKREDYAYIFTMGLRMMLILGLPIAIGTVFVAEPIVLLIFKEKYLPSAATLAIFIWYIPPRLLVFAASASLVARRRERAMTVTLGIGILLNVGSNAMLIMSYGHRGAAMATVISEWFVAITLLVLSRDVILPYLMWLKLPAVALANLCMVSVLLLARELHFLLLIVIGGATYGLALLAFRSLSLGVLLQVVRGRKMESAGE